MGDIVLDFEPISRRLIFNQLENLYQMLTRSGINIRSVCGGFGTCGKCKILIQKGGKYFNSPTDAELKILSRDDIEKGWRLACQTRVENGQIKYLRELQIPQFRIYLPEELLLEGFNILTSGINKGNQLNPNIKKKFIHLNKPSLESPIADLERIISSIQELDKRVVKESSFKIDIDILKKIPDLIRNEGLGITLTLLNDNKIIECESGNRVKDNFGIAFDIGTTTIVGYLTNLNNGKIYSVDSALNPQTAYGEDVVSRISYIKDNENGLQQLNSILLEALNKIIIKTCSKVKINTSHIYEATVVGNSVMHHIFLEINPLNIGLSPYIPVVQQGLNLKAKNLKLNINRGGNVYTLPLIAGFVGADTRGVIISSEIEKESKLTLAIDVGTNGEIIIGNKDILTTASCAAGSALEGAHIKDGMRAAAGAIDTIKIDPENFNVSYTTIKDKKPIGICGSGLIDGVAEMLKSKIITRSGNFNKNIINHSRLIRKNRNIEFIIAKKTETSIGRDIVISLDDIRELQMAKGAFYTAARLILKYLSRKNNSNFEIKQIFLAGAFGNYIKKENAKFIGMIPDIPNKNIFQIGNAAGEGAKKCLLDRDLRLKAQKLSKKIQYIEIAIEKDFQVEYAKSMYFPHLNLELFPNLKEYKDIAKR